MIDIQEQKPALKLLRRKQKLFVFHFTDRTNPKTYDNATQSAIAAGYSDRRAASQGSNLLDEPSIITEIARITQEQEINSRKSREEKAQIAWGQFLNAKTDADKRFWWREHGELSSHYIQRQEITQESRITVTAEQINSAIRDARKSLEVYPQKLIPAHIETSEEILQDDIVKDNLAIAI